MEMGKLRPQGRKTGTIDIGGASERPTIMALRGLEGQLFFQKNG